MVFLRFPGNPSQCVNPRHADRFGRAAEVFCCLGKTLAKARLPLSLERQSRRFLGVARIIGCDCHIFCREIERKNQDDRRDRGAITCIVSTMEWRKSVSAFRVSSDDRPPGASDVINCGGTHQTAQMITATATQATMLPTIPFHMSQNRGGRPACIRTLFAVRRDVIVGGKINVLTIRGLYQSSSPFDNVLCCVHPAERRSARTALR